MIKQILQVCRVFVNARPLFLLLLFMVCVLPAMSQEAKLELRTDTSRAGLQQTDGTIRLGTYVGKKSSGNQTDAGWLGTVSNHPLDLMTNDKFRMRITESGRVGIGTATPAHELEVTGMIKTTKLAITDGARAGRVLTSDAYGRASWTGATQVGSLFLIAGDSVLLGSGYGKAAQITLCGQISCKDQPNFTVSLLLCRDAAGGAKVILASKAAESGQDIMVSSGNVLTIPSTCSTYSLFFSIKDGHKWVISSHRTSPGWIAFDYSMINYTQ